MDSIPWVRCVSGNVLKCTQLTSSFASLFRHKQSPKLEVIGTGISESERQRRKESNGISTKINFAAWLIEVPAALMQILSLVQVIGTVFLILPVPIAVKYQVLFSAWYPLPTPQEIPRKYVKA